jgi:hypothetical protein
MSNYFDEEEEDPGPSCPFCGEKKPCEHMVYASDPGNADFVGGEYCDRLDELVSIIVDGLGKVVVEAGIQPRRDEGPLVELVCGCRPIRSGSS